MRKLTFMAILILIFQLNGKSQDFKVDDRTQFLKEDSKNELQSTVFSNVDIMQALEFAGIKMHKFLIGTFDQKYRIHFLLDEYINGEMVRTDTIWTTNNIYTFDENGTRYFNYVDQIKIITQQEDELVKLNIRTYNKAVETKIEYKTTQGHRFYMRYYLDATWKENVIIPLFIFASSWTDKNGFLRFCGTTQLDDENGETTALLKLSPHYFKISYIVSKY